MLLPRCFCVITVLLVVVLLLVLTTIRMMKGSVGMGEEEEKPGNVSGGGGVDFWTELARRICFFVYWQACVKAPNPFTKLLFTKNFCRVCFLGLCTAWNQQSRFGASLRLGSGTPVAERWPCLSMTYYLGFCFSPTVLGHQQITCWKQPATELIFRKFLSLALSFQNSRRIRYTTKQIGEIECFVRFPRIFFSELSLIFQTLIEIVYFFRQSDLREHVVRICT